VKITPMKTVEGDEPNFLYELRFEITDSLRRLFKSYPEATYGDIQQLATIIFNDAASAWLDDLELEP
jgi:hypothetical protein